MRVLVADDSSDTVESTAMLLRLDGHEVATARDGVEAIGRATEFRPDVVLLDIGMPTLDGYAAARRIQSLSLPPKPYLVAVTGYGTQNDKRLSGEAGFDLHLRKPVGLDTFRGLLALLQTSLDRSRRVAIQNRAVAADLMLQQLEMAHIYLDTAAITGAKDARERCIAHATRAHESVAKWLYSGACSDDRMATVVDALQALSDRLSP
jgi:CheY-like chemotaxis protein